MAKETLREQIEISLCSGMLLDSELWIDDGYYFLTKEHRQRLARGTLSRITERIKGIENPYSVMQGWFDKEEYARGIAFNEAIQRVLKELEE